MLLLLLPLACVCVCVCVCEHCIIMCAYLRDVRRIFGTVATVFFLCFVFFTGTRALQAREKLFMLVMFLFLLLLVYYMSVCVCVYVHKQATAKAESADSSETPNMKINPMAANRKK